MESEYQGPPKKESQFNLTELPLEVQYIIADLLPDKNLLNLRATSKANRELVDEIILRPDNLEKLFNQLTPNQVITFTNVYLSLYRDDFANRVKAPLDLYLHQLKPNDVIDVMTKLHGKNSILDDLIMNYVNELSGMFNVLLNSDQYHLYEFAHKFPNLFQQDMNQPDVPLFKRLIYILTASDVHNLKPDFVRETYRQLSEYRNKNLASLSDRFTDFASSIAFQGILSSCLNSPNYQPVTESASAIEPFFEDALYQAFVNLKGLQLPFHSWNSITFTSPNFSEVNLSTGSFAGLTLTNLLFIRANLTDVNFSGADLTHANFSHANLTNADLSKAILKNTNFSHANLSNCQMFNVNLSTVNLSHANLTGIKFLDRESLLTPDLLTKKLFKFYDMIEGHPQFRQIVKALAEQIYEHAKLAAKKNPAHAFDLVDAALRHGIFRLPDAQKPILQPDIYEKPKKPEPSKELLQLSELKKELTMSPSVNARKR